MLGRRALLSVCALMVLQAQPPATSEVDRVLDAWEARMKGLTSFTCRFRQEKKVSFMRRPLVSTGTMAFRERRLLWRTETPAPGFLAVDATEVRIYTPEFKLLEIYPLAGARAPGASATAGSGASPSQGASPTWSGAFPGFTGDLAALREPYLPELRPLPAGSKEMRLRFTPRREELKKEVVHVEITLDPQYSITTWRIVRANGDELALSIEEFVANAKVSDADLTFDVPADVKVVRPLAGPAK